MRNGIFGHFLIIKLIMDSYVWPKLYLIFVIYNLDLQYIDDLYLDIIILFFLSTK